jgi:hypothetical protein
MNKTTALTFAAIALTLSGCAAAEAPIPAPTVTATPEAIPTPEDPWEYVDDEDLVVACLSDEVGTGKKCLKAAKAYITAYRAKSEDFDTPEKALATVAGQVCMLVRNLPNEQAHENLVEMKGLSEKQADGAIYATKHCRALGWWVI